MVEPGEETWFVNPRGSPALIPVRTIKVRRSHSKQNTDQLKYHTSMPSPTQWWRHSCASNKVHRSSRNSPRPWRLVAEVHCERPMLTSQNIKVRNHRLEDWSTVPVLTKTPEPYGSTKYQRTSAISFKIHRDSFPTLIHLAQESLTDILHPANERRRNPPHPSYIACLTSIRH